MRYLVFGPGYTIFELLKYVFLPEQQYSFRDMSRIKIDRLEEERCTPSQASRLLNISGQRVYTLIEDQRTGPANVGGAHPDPSVLVCGVASVEAIGRGVQGE